MPRTINMPVPFQGSKAEASINRSTHAWAQVDDDGYRCLYCDCKTWHHAADYPCGQEPPRRIVTIND